MKIRFLGALGALVLMAGALAGCSTMGDVSSFGQTIVNQNGTKTYVQVTSVDGVKQVSICAQALPKDKGCHGGTVTSSVGIFTPSMKVYTSRDCMLDPHCQTGDSFAGFAEPTGNVVLNGLFGVATAYAGRSSGDTFDVSGGTAYGGTGGTSYGSTVTNNNTNKQQQKSVNKTDVDVTTKVTTSTGDSGTGGKPPKKPCKPKNNGIQSYGQTSGSGSGSGDGCDN